MASLGIPIPPEVYGQMPDMGRFSPGQQPQPGPAEDPLQQDPNMFAQDALNQIAEVLGKVAQVLLQTRPELAPTIQKMAQAGSELQSQLSAAPQDTGAGVPTQPEGPEDVSMA